MSVRRSVACRASTLCWGQLRPLEGVFVKVQTLRRDAQLSQHGHDLRSMVDLMVEELKGQRFRSEPHADQPGVPPAYDRFHPACPVVLGLQPGARASLKILPGSLQGQEIGIAFFCEWPFLRCDVFAPREFAPRGLAMEPFRTREMNQGSPHGLEPERELLTILLRSQFPDPVPELVPSAEQNVIVFEKVHGSPLGMRWRPTVPFAGAIQDAILIGRLRTDNASFRPEDASTATTSSC